MKPRPLPYNAKMLSKKGKKVFTGARFDVYQWEQKQYDGSIATYEVVKRNDTAIIIPVIGDEVVIVKEQQPHWDSPVYNLVAGIIDKEEDIDAAARREVEEETGYIFEKYTLVHVQTNTPAVEWFAYTFIATNCIGQKEKKLDAGEKNEVLKISFERLIEMVRNREFFYPAGYIEEMLMKDKKAELLESFKNPDKYAIV
jgi:ADP-ribose pyrophosphatase